MKTYIRKMMKHDMTHEVSLTKYVYYDFFGGNSFVSFQIKSKGCLYNVIFNDATDLRFGADFKTMCRMLDVKEGDFLIMKKIGVNLYSIDVDRMSFAKTKAKPYIPFFTDNHRHLIANISGSTINKEYIR